MVLCGNAWYSLVLLEVISLMSSMSSPGRGEKERESEGWKEEGIECEQLSHGSLSHANKPTAVSS